jgi:hypothetical protein
MRVMFNKKYLFLCLSLLYINCYAQSGVNFFMPNLNYGKYSSSAGLGDSIGSIWSKSSFSLAAEIKKQQEVIPEDIRDKFAQLYENTGNHDYLAKKREKAEKITKKIKELKEKLDSQNLLPWKEHEIAAEIEKLEWQLSLLDPYEFMVKEKSPNKINDISIVPDIKKEELNKRDLPEVNSKASGYHVEYIVAPGVKTKPEEAQKEHNLNAEALPFVPSSQQPKPPLNAEASPFVPQQPKPPLNAEAPSFVPSSQQLTPPAQSGPVTTSVPHLSQKEIADMLLPQTNTDDLTDFKKKGFNKYLYEKISYYTQLINESSDAKWTATNIARAIGSLFGIRPKPSRYNDARAVILDCVRFLKALISKMDKDEVWKEDDIALALFGLNGILGFKELSGDSDANNIVMQLSKKLSQFHESNRVRVLSPHHAAMALHAFVNLVSHQYSPSLSIGGSVNKLLNILVSMIERTANESNLSFIHPSDLSTFMYALRDMKIIKYDKERRRLYIALAKILQRTNNVRLSAKDIGMCLYIFKENIFFSLEEGGREAVLDILKNIFRLIKQNSDKCKLDAPAVNMGLQGLSGICSHASLTPEELQAMIRTFVALIPDDGLLLEDGQKQDCIKSVAIIRLHIDQQTYINIIEKIFPTPAQSKTAEGGKPPSNNPPTSVIESDGDDDKIFYPPLDDEEQKTSKASLPPPVDQTFLWMQSVNDDNGGIVVAPLVEATQETSNTGEKDVTKWDSHDRRGLRSFLLKRDYFQSDDLSIIRNVLPHHGCCYKLELFEQLKEFINKHLDDPQNDINFYVSLLFWTKDIAYDSSFIDITRNILLHMKNKLSSQEPQEVDIQKIAQMLYSYCNGKIPEELRSVFMQNLLLLMDKVTSNKSVRSINIIDINMGLRGFAKMPIEEPDVQNALRKFIAMIPLSIFNIGNVDMNQTLQIREAINSIKNKINKKRTPNCEDILSFIEYVDAALRPPAYQALPLLPPPPPYQAPPLLSPPPSQLYSGSADPALLLKQQKHEKDIRDSLLKLLEPE